jgi:hypothetical protein
VSKKTHKSKRNEVVRAKKNTKIIAKIKMQRNRTSKQYLAKVEHA